MAVSDFFEASEANETALARLRYFAGEPKPRRLGEPAPTFWVVRIPGLGAKVLLISRNGGMSDVTEELASLWGCEYDRRFGLATTFPTGADALHLMAIHIGDALHPRPDKALLPCVRFEEVS